MFQQEINEFTEKTAKEKEEWQQAVQQEQQRQKIKQQTAAVKIQAFYRGYR